MRPLPSAVALGPRPSASLVPELCLAELEADQMLNVARAPRRDAGSLSGSTAALTSPDLRRWVSFVRTSSCSPVEARLIRIVAPHGRCRAGALRKVTETPPTRLRRRSPA